MADVSDWMFISPLMLSVSLVKETIWRLGDWLRHGIIRYLGEEKRTKKDGPLR